MFIPTMFEKKKNIGGEIKPKHPYKYFHITSENVGKNTGKKDNSIFLCVKYHYIKYLGDNKKNHKNKSNHPIVIIIQDNAIMTILIII